MLTLSCYSYLSLGTEVFLNLLIVTETSCSKSQPRRFSAFFEGPGVSVFTADTFSYTYAYTIETMRERPVFYRNLVTRIIQS